MVEKYKSQMERFGETLKTARLNDSLDIKDQWPYVECLVNNRAEAKKLENILTVLSSLNYFDCNFLTSDEILNFWSFINDIYSLASERDKPWFTPADEQKIKDKIHASPFLKTIPRDQSVMTQINSVLDDLNHQYRALLDERFSGFETRKNIFETHTPEGRLISPESLRNCFQSGVILAHAITPDSKNYLNIFRQIVFDGELEAEASLMKSNKLLVDSRSRPSRYGPYILPDISFYANGIVDEINFLVPMEDAIKDHSFYGERTTNSRKLHNLDQSFRHREFHVYPTDEISIQAYNNFRENSDPDFLQTYHNAVSIKNSIIFIVRTPQREYLINPLIHTLLDKRSKAKGFIVIDFDDQSKAFFEKQKLYKYLHINDILLQWASFNGIQLYDGEINKHPNLENRLNVTTFPFAAIHGGDAFDRSRNIFYTLKP